MNRQEIFRWVKEQYGTEPDYPWQDANAVLRHQKMVRPDNECGQG